MTTNHQAPQFEPVQSPATHVLGDDGGHGLRVEGRDIRQRPRREQLVYEINRADERSQACTGDAETLLWRAGDVRPRRFDGPVLAGAASSYPPQTL